MMYAKKITVVSLVSLMACLTGQIALGNGKHMQAPVQVQEFKLIPRVSLWGFGGDYNRGEGQALVPLLGDASRVLYFLAEGNKVVNDSGWMGGAGVGYRQVVNERIFGGYLIGNYHNSSENNGFYIANPGLEMLGQAWDINVNGYFPFMQRKSVEIQEVPASELLGSTQFIRFSGHNEFDHELRVLGGKNKLNEEAGRGFDAEVGRVVPKIENLRIYIGGYHFEADDVDSVNGAEARAVYEFNRFFALEGEYNYDNLNHSKAVLGLRFTLGGYSAEEKKIYGISTRLLDPIEHDLVVGSSGPAEIIAANRIIDLGEKPIHDNIQFFKPLVAGGTKGNDVGPGSIQGSGTFEDPFIGFTPQNVGSIPERLGPIDQHPLLYFAPGAYSFTGFSVNHGAGPIQDRFNLPNGWGMFGRTQVYTAPAMGDQRAQFTGGLDMNYAAGAGGAATTLNSVHIINTKAADPELENFDNVTLYINNAANVVLQNSFIETRVTGDVEDSLLALGIYGNASTINFKQLIGAISGENTVFSFSQNTNNTPGSEAVPFGIFADVNKLIINFESGTNAVTVNGISPIDVGSTCMAGNFSQINFKGGTNSLNAFGQSEHEVSTQEITAFGGDSAINFLGGNNALNSIATAPDVISFSIVGDDRTIIDFRAGNNTFNSLLNSPVGLNISIRLITSDSDIRINGVSISEGTISPDYFSLLPYVSIIRTTSGPTSVAGLKISWSGHDGLPW